MWKYGEKRSGLNERNDVMAKGKDLKWYERCYLLDLTKINPTKNGMDKFVYWFKGMGLMNLKVVAKYKAAWVTVKDGQLAPTEGRMRNFKEYLDYWRKRGAIVKEISADEAAKVYDKFNRANQGKAGSGMPEVAKPAQPLTSGGEIVHYRCKFCGNEWDGAAGNLNCPQCGNVGGEVLSSKTTEEAATEQYSKKAAQQKFTKTELKKMRKAQLLGMADELDLEVPDGITKRKLVDLVYPAV